MKLEVDTGRMEVAVGWKVFRDWKVTIMAALRLSLIGLGSSGRFDLVWVILGTVLSVRART